MLWVRQDDPCRVSAGRGIIPSARIQYTTPRAEEHIVRDLIRNNIIVFVMLLYVLFMASFKIWPVW